MGLMRGGVAGLLALAMTAPALANGHGPVFGLATPTNGKGGWTLDFGPMLLGGSLGTAAMMRMMLTYGLTPNVQLSLSAPARFAAAVLPAARGTAMMPMDDSFEALAGWRFQRHEPAVGTRVESTAYFGLELPAVQPQAGMLGSLHPALGTYTAVATGLASRVNYFWAGIGDQHFFSRDGDQRPSTLFYSLVYGYRPLAWRQHYPGLDWRFFAEMTGAHDSAVRQAGRILAGTAGNQIFLGPSVLVIHKDVGVEFGLQWPVYRSAAPQFPRERYRAALDVSYFF